MIVVFNWTSKIAIAAAKKVKLVEGDTDYLQRNYRLAIGINFPYKPTHAAQEFLEYYHILVDHEQLYLRSCNKIVLDPIFSPIDIAAVKHQHAAKRGL